MAARALDGLLTECATTPHCAAAFPALRQEATQVFDRVRQAPQTAMVAHPSGGAPARVTLTRNHVGEAIRYMLYTSGSASSVPFVLHRAFEGDFEPIAAFLIGWRASGTFDGLYLSITCAEDVPFVAADAAELDEGTFLGGYRVREQRAACAEWPRGRVAPEQFEPVVSDVPVLIFTGGLDPVTPASNGDEVIKTLPNGIHLPIPSAGHSAAGLVGTECISALQAALIERGTTSGLKTDCIRQIRRSGFRTR
jgi:pimeloyl-ACP methyl ester carboxylesterase